MPPGRPCLAMPGTALCHQWERGWKEHQEQPLGEPVLLPVPQLQQPEPAGVRRARAGKTPCPCPQLSSTQHNSPPTTSAPELPTPTCLLLLLPPHTLFTRSEPFRVPERPSGLTTTSKNNVNLSIDPLLLWGPTAQKRLGRSEKGYLLPSLAQVSNYYCGAVAPSLAIP